MLLTICPSDDERSIARLLTALHAAGAMFDDFIDGSLGAGVSTFRVGEQILSVYRDVWLVDLAGPDDLVNRVVEILSSNAEYTTPR